MKHYFAHLWGGLGAARPYIVYMVELLIIIPIVIYATVFYIGTLYTQPPAPPLAYTAKEYTPERLVYLPGDTMVFTPALSVKVVDTVQIVRGIRNAETHRQALLCDGTLSDVSSRIPAPYGFADLNAALEGPFPFPIPNLPPGRYELNNDVFSLHPSGGSAQYSVFFLVARPCPD